MCTHFAIYLHDHHNRPPRHTSNALAFLSLFFNVLLHLSMSPPAFARTVTSCTVCKLHLRALGCHASPSLRRRSLMSPAITRHVHIPPLRVGIDLCARDLHLHVTQGWQTASGPVVLRRDDCSDAPQHSTQLCSTGRLLEWLAVSCQQYIRICQLPHQPSRRAAVCSLLVRSCFQLSAPIRHQLSPELTHTHTARSPLVPHSTPLCTYRASYTTATQRLTPTTAAAGCHHSNPTHNPGED